MLSSCKKVSLEDKLEIAINFKLETDNYLKNISNYHFQIMKKHDKVPEINFPFFIVALSASHQVEAPEVSVGSVTC